MRLISVEVSESRMPTSLAFASKYRCSDVMLMASWSRETPEILCRSATAAVREPRVTETWSLAEASAWPRLVAMDENRFCADTPWIQSAASEEPKSLASALAAPLL